MDSTHQPGDVVNSRYRIIRALGRGGAATTYEALDEQVGQAVALKVLDMRSLGEWKKLELFEREVATLKALVHPCIPRYIDSFKIEEGVPRFYLVQELAPGRTLADLISNGFHPDEPQVRQIAEGLLRILRYLESRTPPVVHRDIKPQNVLRSDAGEMYLVDFGAVNDVRREDGGSTVVGTYGYMAPEQLRGQATSASDLYGLGATLAFLSTRRSPADLPQKKLKIDIRAHASLSPEFARWLDKLLEPAPEDRFSTAREATIALERGMPRLSGSSSRRVIFIAAAVGVVAVAGGLVAFRKFAPRREVLANDAAAQTSVHPVRVLSGHWSAVFSVAFAPDGKTIASGSNDQTLKLWNAETGKPIHDFPVKGARVSAVAFSRDGALLLGGSGNSIYTWDAATGTIGKTMTGHEGPVSALAMNWTDELVISAALDGTVRTWDRKSGEARQTLRHGGRVFSVAVSSDGKTIASGGGDGNVKLWDIETGAEIRSLSHGATVNGVAFAPDGVTLVSVGDNHLAKVWISNPGKLARTLEGHTDEVWCTAIQPDGRSVATSGKDNTIRIWDIYSGKIKKSFPGDTMGVLSMAQSPNGALLATGAGTGTIRLWALGDDEDEADIDVAGRAGWTALHVAAYEGDLEAVKAQLAQGTPVDARNAMKRTPLYNAAKKGHLAIATHLIEHGATIDALAERGFTPIYVAAQNGHREIVDLFIAKGADPHHKNDFDQSYLYKAAEGGHVEVAKIFIGKGAAINDVDKWRWTPLAIACSHGHSRMVELLLAQSGIDTSIANVKSGQTPVMLAASKGYDDIVRQLVEKGVDLNAKSAKGETALSLAERYRHQKIAAFLREKGAQ